MNKIEKLLTRKDVRSRTGWSLTFIDRHLPRVKVGGKVLIPLADLERLLQGGSNDAR